MFGLAWLRPAGNFLKQTTHAHSSDLFAGNGKSREYALEYEIESVGLWRSRAAGQPDRRDSVQRREQQQIAGIDGHSKAQDLTAGRNDRRRNNVAPVRNGGRAKYEENLRPVLRGFFQRRCERLCPMRYATLQDDMSIQRREPRVESC